MLPVLVILLAAALWSIAIAADRLSCLDAARDGARAAARGESAAAVVAAAKAAGPAGSVVEVTRAGDQVSVLVRVRVGPASGVLARLPAPVVAVTAVARSEVAGEP